VNDLEELMQANAARREKQLEQARQDAEEAAEQIDRIANPHETDGQRQARREQEADRARLARLGVVFR